jgi:hypothetical protein
MDLYRPTKEKSDCDVILEDVENVFGSLGDCLDAVIDERKSKMDVAKGVWGIGKNLLKFGFNGTRCAVKYTPKAIVTVANAKRELTDTIAGEYQKYQKEQREQALEERIKRIAESTKKHH